MKVFLLITLSLFLLLVFPSPISAADFNFDQDNFFLQTSGQHQISETAILKNQTAEPKTVTFSWKKFAESSHTIDFASLEPIELTLQPYAIGTVTVKFSTPAAIQSGDYYGTLVAQSGDQTAETGFTLRFLGQLTEKISRDSLVFDKGKLTLQLSNKGNVTTKVSGKVIVTNFFGQKVFEDEITTTNLKATDRFSQQFDLTTIPGPYQAKLELITGEKEVNQTSLSSFWSNPTLFAVGVVGIIIVFVFVTLLAWRKIHA